MHIDTKTDEEIIQASSFLNLCEEEKDRS